MKLISLDSSNGDILFEKQGYTCLNINALVGRRLDEKNLKTRIQSLVLNSRTVNLCNLASLCYKLHIKYDSFDCLNLLQLIVDNIKNLYDVCFIQNNIENKFEVDLKPFEILFRIDVNNSIIYISKLFKDKLNFIGFADSQMIDLITHVKDLYKYIPTDIISDIPINNEWTLTTYSYIKEILN